VEEFGLHIAPGAVFHAADYIAQNPTRRVMFFAARIAPAEVAGIRFGEEGQCWRMMPVTAFCSRPDAVRELQAALRAVPGAC
jgi:hypothetical protein